VDHRSANRPAFPAQWFTAYFVLSSGSDALLPPSPSGSLMRTPGRAATSPLDLTHRPRASGPHDLTVRAHPRWDFESWRVLTPEAMRKRCRHRVVRAVVTAHGKAALQFRSRPTPSRPSLPCPPFVTIAIRPLSRPGWFVCTVNQNFGKVEYFWRGGLTGEVGELRGVFCPTGDKAAATPPTAAPSGGRRLFP
jgi:hypothetical protein